MKPSKRFMWLALACVLAPVLGCSGPAARGSGAPTQDPGAAAPGDLARRSTPAEPATDAEGAPARDAVSDPSASFEAGAATASADTAPPNPPAEADAAAPEAPTTSGRGECEAERARVEARVQRAARCDTHEECAMGFVHTAFGACGAALRKDAPLEALRADAIRYAARCNPPLVRVRCAYHTGALCTRQRCTLAAPDALEAAGVQPAKL